MKQKLFTLLFTSLIALLTIYAIGCNSSSSNNPSGPGSNSSDLVGTWRCVAFAMIPPGTSTLHNSVVTDSNYMVVDASLHFVATYRLTNGNVQRYVGRFTYTPPMLMATIDSANSAGQGTSDTVVPGSVVHYYVAALNSTILDLRDTTTTYHIPEYHGYLKVGTDVKIGGYTGMGTGVANVVISGASSHGRIYDGGITSNSWGFYGVGNLAIDDWRLHGALNGAYYDNPDTLRITAAGVYPCALEP